METEMNNRTNTHLSLDVSLLSNLFWCVSTDLQFHLYSHQIWRQGHNKILNIVIMIEHLWWIMLSMASSLLHNLHVNQEHRCLACLLRWSITLQVNKYTPVQMVCSKGQKVKLFHLITPLRIAAVRKGFLIDRLTWLWLLICLSF